MTDFLQSINPATGEVVYRVRKTSPQEVEFHVQTARTGFGQWQNQPLRDRIDCVKRVKALLIERSDLFADMITKEMGRPRTEALVLELSASLDVMDYYIRKGPVLLKEKTVPVHNLLFKFRESRYLTQPLGVLGIITPWNWPLLIPLGCIVPALIAGNGIVFKPSEYTPGTGQMIRQLFLDAGVPEDVFQAVQGHGDVGQALVLSDVEKLFFTGSTEVGQKIMEQAAHNLKPVVLELGGHDPAIVCNDANLESTTSGLVWGSFCNAGQNCNGVERIFVQEDVLDLFVKKFVQKVSQLRLGDGMLPDSDMGALALEKELIKMEAIIQNAVRDGSEILVGGKRKESLGKQFFEPTVLLHPNRQTMPEDCEYFGPVVILIPFSDDEEAIAMANCSEFGLTASVWSQNRKRSKMIASRLEAGTVMINDVIVSFGIPESDWTGVKKSGVGWVHGEKGLDEMVNKKFLHRNRLSRSQNFWWFPYEKSMSTGIGFGHIYLYHASRIQKMKALIRTLLTFFPYLLINRTKKTKL